MHNLSGIAAYLLRDELLDAESTSKAIDAAIQQKISLITYLVRSNILSGQNILSCCVKYFALSVFDLTNFNLTVLQDSIIHPDLMLKHRVIPLYRNDDALHIGVSDPTNHDAISTISFHSGLSIHIMLVCETDLDIILSSLSRSNRIGTQLESALSRLAPVEDKSSVYETTDHDDGPVSEFVDRLIQNAIEQHVSDIHIEPFTHHCRIRFRRDGLLYEVATTPPHFAARMITRLKIMSHLNIAERRLPQDGRLSLQQSSLMDIRINTCPTLYGEKIVLRILDASKIKLDINALGFTPSQQSLFTAKLMQPQGLILVTGPTGSGKTITLYSALHFLNQIEKNISSVEDPVEIEFAGITQVNINPRIGLDFAMVLRSLLRQDPDIIMIGEIRDAQTASIAIQAAQTGHLVLSTLHTNSAIETIARLQSMGIAAYHFISAVSLIMAQRLVRKLCAHCKQAIQAPETIQQHSCISYRPVGCDRCQQGYQGRIAIFELIPISEKLASTILSGANSNQLLEILKKESWTLLWGSGMELVQKGITTRDELIRVVGNAEEKGELSCIGET